MSFSSNSMSFYQIRIFDFYRNIFSSEDITDITVKNLDHPLSYGLTLNDNFRENLNNIFHSKPVNNQKTGKSRLSSISDATKYY